MNLDDIPSGGNVLLDANLLIYAAEAISKESQRLLTRCARHDLKGFITAITAAEFCHRRMMQEAQSLGLVAQNPAKALSHDRMLIRKLVATLTRWRICLPAIWSSFRLSRLTS